MFLVLRTITDSEKRFYGLLRDNVQISIKDLCRKIPGRIVYQYLRNLLEMQGRTSQEIIRRKAGLCDKTRLPIVLLERKISIDVVDFPNCSYIYFGGVNFPGNELAVHCTGTGSVVQRNYGLREITNSCFLG
jgi:hypothetical protein